MIRRDVKESHEKCVLEGFKTYCGLLNHRLEIIERPDPPDAIIDFNGKRMWIEITDAFISKELAESITSFASEDKKNIPIPKNKRFIVSPHERFSSILKETILKKYEKPSINDIFNRYGSGILLVGIVNPFTSANEVLDREKEKLLEEINSKEKIFHSIYFFDGLCSSFYQLL